MPGMSQARKEEMERAAERAAVEERLKRDQQEAMKRAEHQRALKLKLLVHKDVKARSRSQSLCDTFSTHACNAFLCCVQERIQAQMQQHQVAEEHARRSLQVLTPQQAAAVAHRNAAAVNRRRDLLASKDAAAKQRAQTQRKLLEKVHVDAPSDPNRILRGTASQMHRVKENQQEERQPRESGFILHLTGLSVPSWRAGL